MGWNVRVSFSYDIEILGSTKSEASQRDLDKVFQCSVGLDLPLQMYKCQQLMEEEANSSLHIGPPGH